MGALLSHIPLVRTHGMPTYPGYAIGQTVIWRSPPRARRTPGSPHRPYARRNDRPKRCCGRFRARHPPPGVLRLHQAGAGRRRHRAVHRAGLRRDQPGRDRRRRPGHQGRALPPLQRQAGAVRGRLREGGGRGEQDDPQGGPRQRRPVGEGAGRVCGSSSRWSRSRATGGSSSRRARRCSATSATASRRSARRSASSRTSSPRCSSPTPSSRAWSRRSAGSSSARCRPPGPRSPRRRTRARASAEVEAAIAFILAGLRQQAESGETLPGPDDLVTDEAPGPGDEAG